MPLVMTASKFDWTHPSNEDRETFNRLFPEGMEVTEENVRTLWGASVEVVRLGLAFWGAKHRRGVDALGDVYDEARKVLRDQRDKVLVDDDVEDAFAHAEYTKAIAAEFQVYKTYLIRLFVSHAVTYGI